MQCHFIAEKTTFRKVRCISQSHTAQKWWKAGTEPGLFVLKVLKAIFVDLIKAHNYLFFILFKTGVLGEVN